jgi:ATP-dependent Lon protease
MQRDVRKKESPKSKKQTQQEEKLRKKKSNESSDNESSDNESSSGEDDYEEDMNEYRKFLKKKYPSKFIDSKINAYERLKQTTHKSVHHSKDDNKRGVLCKNDEAQDTALYCSKRKRRPSFATRKRSKLEHPSKSKNHSRKHEENNDFEESEESENSEDDNNSCDSDTEDNEHEDSDTESSDEQEDDVYIYEEPSKKSSNKFNIIFTIGGKSTAEQDDEWETCSDESTTSETENEDESVSTDECTSESESEVERKREKTKEKMNTKRIRENPTNAIKGKPDIQEEETNRKILEQLRLLHAANPNNKSIEKCVEIYSTDLTKQSEKKQKKIKKQKEKNKRIFTKILYDKNTMNDVSYYDKLDIDTQKKFIKELREINKIMRVEKPYRSSLLESDMPVRFKAVAMKKINSLRYMDQGSGEFYKIKNWVDTFMRIPFGKYTHLPVSIADGADKCHTFMETAQQTLDDAVYGLNDAKMQIMQMLGQLITNPTAIGSAIAIHGPPGTGKTSLVKEGISKILNRPFAFIALGGATDSSFLEGHGYTYEGSTWGKIVQILIESKCMNPVIYFDELDKISDTPKGEEIAGILTHLTDTSQNSQFHDKYFTEVDFDLSKCLFIFSYNDESKINPILKDRMYRIQTKGYSPKQKTIISIQYLLPKIREQVKFEPGEIIISEQVIGYIIDYYCNKEDGIRNLKRCLEIVHTKLNLYRLMRPDCNLFEEDMSLKVEFPFNVTKDVVDKLIKKSDLNPSLYMLYT